MLGSEPHSHLSFTNTPAESILQKALNLPPRNHYKKRTEATLAYLRSEAFDELEEEGNETDVRIPEPAPAPLQVVEADGRLQALPPRDELSEEARNLAIEGWEALKDYLDDLADLRPRIVNQTPMLARALTRFERAMGATYEDARPVQLGTHGLHVVAQTNAVADTMDESDAVSLRSFATAIGLFLERFPEWRAYRDAALQRPLTAIQTEAALQPIEELIGATKEHQEAISKEIPVLLEDQLAVARDAPDNPVLGRGILDSVQNLLSALAKVTVKFIKTEAKDLTKMTWNGLKKLTSTALAGAALDIIVNKAGALQVLATSFPEQFGWILPLLRLIGL